LSYFWIAVNYQTWRIYPTSTGFLFLPRSLAVLKNLFDCSSVTL
jgi:hypothetical protein